MFRGLDRQESTQPLRTPYQAPKQGSKWNKRTFHALSSDLPGKTVVTPGTDLLGAPLDSVPVTSDVPVLENAAPAVQGWSSEKQKHRWQKKGKGPGKGKKGRGKGGKRDMWKGAPPFRPRSGVPSLY